MSVGIRWRSLIAARISRIGEAPFRVRRLPGAGERVVVALKHEERRAVEDLILLREREEFLVHRQVFDRVHEIVRAGAQRGLGDHEFGRVHGESHARGMGCIAGRLDDRLLRGEVIAGLMDEPDLDVVGLARELARHQRARRRRRRAILMIGGSPRSSCGRSIMEMSGPGDGHARRRGGARARASRTSKFQNGPPTSTTLVTPLASHTLNVAASRALLRSTSRA